MPDAVSVRQVNGLPRASFRSRLTTDTLASDYVLGATTRTRDFHPLETCPCRAHKEKPRDVAVTGPENLGCEMGLEPTTTGITIRDSTN